MGGGRGLTHIDNRKITAPCVTNACKTGPSPFSSQTQSPIARWLEPTDLSCSSARPGPGGRPAAPACSRHGRRWRWGGLALRDPSGTGELLCVPPGFGPWRFCCQRVKCFLVRQNIHWGSSTEQFSSGKKRSCLKATAEARLGSFCSPQRLTFSLLKALLPPTIPGHGVPGDSSCEVLRPLSGQVCTPLPPGFLPGNYKTYSNEGSLGGRNLLKCFNMLERGGSASEQDELLLRHRHPQVLRTK